MTLTLTKKLDFEKILTDFKRFTLKNCSRQVLQNLYYDPSGYIVATNSHVLMRVNNEYIDNMPTDFTPGKTYHPKWNFVTEINYPKTENLITDPIHSEITVTLNDDGIKELQAALKQLKTIYKDIKNKVVTLKIGKNESILKSGYQKIIIYSDPSKNQSENIEKEIALKNIYADGEFTVNVNGDYLNNILMSIKKLNRISGQPTQVHFYHKYKPIHFTQPGYYDFLLLPLRIY